MARCPSAPCSLHVGDWSYESDNGRYLYFGRDHRSSSTTSLAVDIVGIDLLSNPPKVFDVTGSEFSSGTAPSMELSSTMYVNELRLAPNTKNEMYFIGRPLRKVSGTTTTYFDQNIYKFDFEKGGVAKKVTNYTGSSTSLNNVIHILDNRPLSDGSVVYAASKGSHSSLTGRHQKVNWHKGDGTSAPVEIGKFASGFCVSTGTIKVVEKTGAVYWVQNTSTSSSSPRNDTLYMALLNNTMKGHPLSLSGLPLLTSPLSIGNIVIMTASDTK